MDAARRPCRQPARGRPGHITGSRGHRVAQRQYIRRGSGIAVPRPAPSAHPRDERRL